MKELKANLTDANYKKLLYLMKDYDDRKSIGGYKTTIDDMINILIEREHWVFSQKDMPAK